MKKLILLLTIQLVAMTLCAQKPHNFSGENQSIFIEPNTTETVKLGDPKDVDSKYFWRFVENPNNGATILNDKSCECTVKITKSGSYRIEVNRLSEYGYQTEYVSVDAVESFDIIGVKKKKGRGCFSGSGTISIYDFEFQTDAAVKNVYNYVRIKDGYDDVKMPSVLLWKSQDVRFERKELKANGQEEWVDVTPVGTVHSVSTNTINVGLGGSGVGEFDKFKNKLDKINNALGKAPLEAATKKILNKTMKNVDKAISFGKDASKIIKKAASFPTKSPIEVYVNHGGSLGFTLSAECDEEYVCHKLNWLMGGYTVTAGFHGNFPTTWTIPHVAGLYVTADLSVSITVNANVDMYWSEGHKNGGEFKINVPIVFAGEAGVAAGTHDPNVFQVRGVFRITLAAEFFVAPSGYSSDPRKYYVDAAVYVVFKSLKVGETIFPIYHYEGKSNSWGSK